MEHHRLKKLNLWFSFFLVLGLFILFIFNFKLFIFLISMCILTYYWVEIDANLKDSKSLTRDRAKFLIILNVIFILLSLLSIMDNFYNLIISVAVLANSYFIFKLYWLVVKGIRNRQIKYIPSIVLLFLSWILSITVYFLLGKLFLAVIVIALAIIYDSFYWITKLYLERGDTNRELE